MRSTVMATTLLLSIALMLAAPGCDKKADEPAKTETTTAKAGDAAAPAVPAATLELLAKADAKDGKADKTVSQCPACMMKMAGSADHSCDIGGYAMHSCSESCKEAVKSDTAGILAKALK